MPIFDPNKIAARTLRETLWNHARAERVYRRNLFGAWRKAKADARNRPAPRTKHLGRYVNEFTFRLNDANVKRR